MTDVLSCSVGMHVVELGQQKGISDGHAESPLPGAQVCPPRASSSNERSILRAVLVPSTLDRRRSRLFMRCD